MDKYRIVVEEYVNPEYGTGRIDAKELWDEIRPPEQVEVDAVREDAAWRYPYQSQVTITGVDGTETAVPANVELHAIKVQKLVEKAGKLAAYQTLTDIRPDGKGEDETE